MTDASDLLPTIRMEAVNAGRERRRRELFEGRQYRVMAELPPARLDLPGGGEWVSSRGEFWILGCDAVYTTPLGSKGQRGFYVCEISPADGTDKQPREILCFGHSALEAAQKDFGSVPDLPSGRRKAPAK